MTRPENGKPLWNESQVGALLEEFFEREMPADLQTESPELPPRERFPQSRPMRSEPSRKTGASARSRPRSIVGVLAVGLSSLLMVMIALLYWHQPTSDRPGESDPSVAGPEEAENGDSVIDAIEQDGNGPVESRRIHSVGQGDPGENMEFPELDIEVFPLDPDAKEPEESENRSLPEQNPSDAERTPMPEQGRHLPESRRPESDDPDEADDLPLLPELDSDAIEFF